VSHWEINSDSTVKLITSAVGAISKDNTVGRAEALRRSMLGMIDNGKPHEAHPAYWAPFMVVGDGGVPALVPAAAREIVSVNVAPIKQPIAKPPSKVQAAQKGSAKLRRPSAKVSHEDWAASVFPR
jgi:hypothetical protein